jgi:hypothetical protein
LTPQPHLHPICCRSPGTRLAAQLADAQDALDNMNLLDDIYTAAGLPLRLPTHQYLAAAKAPLSA